MSDTSVTDTALTDEERGAFVANLTEIDQEIANALKHHGNWRGFWTTTMYGLGLPSVVIGAVAAYGGIIEDNATLAGVLALVAAVLTAIIGFLAPGEKRAGHIEALVLQRELRDDIRSATAKLSKHDLTFQQAETCVEDLKGKRRRADAKIAELGIS